MKPIFWILGLVAVLLVAAGDAVRRGFAGPPALAAAARGITLDDVVLVEPGVSRRVHQRLVVEDGHIAEISGARGNGSFPGAYVLPGLVDAHAHYPPALLPGQAELFSFLFLRHGVTGVRVPGDVNPGASGGARARIRAGEFAGPRIATCGLFIDGPEPLFASALVVTTEAEARAAVAEVAAAGFDCVKVYNELDAVALAALREAAAAHGLPVIGHVPWRLSFEEARLDDVQHMLGFHPRQSADPFASMDGWFEVTPERVRAVTAAALRNPTAMTTTLVAGHRISNAHAVLQDADDPMRKWLPPWYAEALWRSPGGINPANRLTDAQFATLRRVQQRTASIVKQLLEAGVVLRAGTDTFAPMLVPGASLIEELELYVAAGLTPEQALSVGTAGSAGALGVAGLGTLQPGAPADLVIYRDDPSQDLAALDTLLAVVQDGRVYTREMLEAQQARYREDFDGVFQQHVAPVLLRAGLDFMRRRSVGARAAER